MHYDIKKFINLFKRKSNQYAFILKEIKEDNSGRLKAIVQVAGKPVFFPIRIRELIRNESILYQFPPEHIKTLVTLGCNEIYSENPYKISAIDFEKLEIIVKESATGKYFNFSADQIKELELLNSFSKEDAFKIGMLYHENIQKSDNEEIKSIRKPKLNIISMNK